MLYGSIRPLHVGDLAKYCRRNQRTDLISFKEAFKAGGAAKGSGSGNV